MTPHSRDQLTMTAGGPDETNSPEPPSGPASGETYYIRLYDKGRARMRPAVLSFPEVGSHCVVHTPEDYPRSLKCMSAERFSSFVEPKMKTWEPSPQQKQHIALAREGEYDDDARESGYDDVISYVLRLFETEARFTTTWADLRPPL